MRLALSLCRSRGCRCSLVTLSPTSLPHPGPRQLRSPALMPVPPRRSTAIGISFPTPTSPAFSPSTVLSARTAGSSTSTGILAITSWSSTTLRRVRPSAFLATGTRNVRSCSSTRARSGIRRNFDVTARLPGHRTFLHVGAANYESFWWVNGQRVCDHEGWLHHLRLRHHDRVSPRPELHRRRRRRHAPAGWSAGQ